MCTNAVQGIQAYKNAHEATPKAHEAAHSNLQKPSTLQTPFWCDGAGSSTGALDMFTHGTQLCTAMVAGLQGGS